MNRVQLLTFVFLGLSSFQMMGCGSDGSKTGSPLSSGTSHVFEKMGLDGKHFIGECKRNGNFSGRHRYHFSHSSYVRLWTNYRDTSCSLNRESSVYEFRFGDAIVQKNPARKQYTRVSFLVDKVLLTPKLDITADFLTKDQAFGFSDWKVGETKEIQGRSYSPGEDKLFKTGTAREFTIRYENSQLKIALYDGEKISNDSDVLEQE